MGGGGGGKGIYFWKGLFTGSPKILLAKSCCGRSLKCDATHGATHQPQLKMLLLLTSLEDIRVKEAEATDRFLISAPVQKIF